MLERQPGVPGRHVGQPPLLAALCRAHLDRRAAPVGHEELEQVRVLEPARDDDLAGDRDLSAVVLEGEAPQHVGLAAAGGVLEVEAVPVRESSVAEVEELDVGGVLADADAQDVGRAQAAAVGDLPLGEWRTAISRLR